MATRREYNPDADAAIFILRRERWTTARIARALGRSHISVEHHLARLKKLGVEQPFKHVAPRRLERPEDNAPEGETWMDVPARGLSLSSADRVKSLRSGYIIRQFRESETGRPAVNYAAGGRRGTISLRNLRREAEGDEGSAFRRYTLIEDAAVRSAGSLQELHRALPGRTESSLRNRARILGIDIKKRAPVLFIAPAERATEWQVQIDYRDIRRAAPAHLLPDVRDDLIQMVTLLYGEGYTGTLPDAFRFALRRLRKESNYYTTISLEAPIRGCEDLRLLDLIDANRPHF